MHTLNEFRWEELLYNSGSNSTLSTKKFEFLHLLLSFFSNILYHNEKKAIWGGEKLNE